MLAQRAALYHMHRWIAARVLPPIAPRIQFAGAAIARDVHGNALGGLRLPHVDVPVARYSGEAAAACSPHSGVTQFFDVATLAARYPSQQAYEDKLRAATDAAVAAGFILPADANYWYCGDYSLGERLEFSPFHDCDDDGVADAVDNCPQRANTGLEDDGGIASAVADGIGDACQCGDVSGNGIVNGQDANAIQRHGLGAHAEPAVRRARKLRRLRQRRLQRPGRERREARRARAAEPEVRPELPQRRRHDGAAGL